MTLLSQHCVVCKKDSTPIESSLIALHLLDIPQWQLSNIKGIQCLQRVYELNNFANAILLTNKIAELAEQQGHHPAILTEWGKVTVQWWTHSIGGLHINDFIMAAKTEQLCT
ncbi:MAG: 4a-hydroxytetrahydrobiopterin dehydratase [Colwellia sp.]|nr:4a-hydroxytetrahydrobiopterin dehydratase [Colwellia sp.]